MEQESHQLSCDCPIHLGTWFAWAFDAACMEPTQANWLLQVVHQQRNCEVHEGGNKLICYTSHRAEEASQHPPVTQIAVQHVEACVTSRNDMFSGYPQPHGDREEAADCRLLVHTPCPSDLLCIQVDEEGTVPCNTVVLSPKRQHYLRASATPWSWSSAQASTTVWAPCTSQLHISFFQLVSSDFKKYLAYLFMLTQCTYMYTKYWHAPMYRDPPLFTSSLTLFASFHLHNLHSALSTDKSCFRIA